jgi:hypothetical protein
VITVAVMVTTVLVIWIWRLAPRHRCSCQIAPTRTPRTAAIENLEDASFVFDRGIGSLIENAPHMVTLRGSAAVVHFCALLMTRT